MIRETKESLHQIHFHKRSNTLLYSNMSDALDQIKELGSQSANTFIALVKSNPAASIAIGSVVVVLLILCVYLKRRCSTNAILMSKTQFESVLRNSALGEDSADVVTRPPPQSPTQNVEHRKRTSEKPVSHQRFKQLFKKHRVKNNQKVPKRWTYDDAEKPFKRFPISMNISYDTVISNCSSTDIDIESNVEEGVEVTMVDEGRLDNSQPLTKERCLAQGVKNSQHDNSLKSSQRNVFTGDKSSRKRWFR